ncbi:hypothetical protein Tco_0587127, partial [Tanacetum coccineum]
MDAPLMDMEEDLAALFGDDDFEDDATDAVGEGPFFPHPALGLPVPPFVIEDLSICL